MHRAEFEGEINETLTEPVDTKPRYTRSDTAGSITPLIFAYFTIAMILIFLISNVAAAYVARRDLTSRVEASISRAAQEIDEVRYYYSGPATDFLAGVALERGELFVPIDCADAGRVFRDSLTLLSRNGSSATNGTSSADFTFELMEGRESLRKEPVIDWFRCEGSQLAVRVTERFTLPFRIPLLNKSYFVNHVEVSADSIYR